MQPRPAMLTTAASLIEDAAAVGSLALMALLPALEVVLRGLFGTGIPGTSGYVENLTLWVAYLGAVIAAREGRHLGLATNIARLPAALRGAAAQAVAFLSAAVV